MDMRCPKCGEPWDIDCIHDEVQARNPVDTWHPDGHYSQAEYDKVYKPVLHEFQRDGCAALKSYGAKCTADAGSAGPLAAAMYDLLGDDLDGAASMLQDAEDMGLL